MGVIQSTINQALSTVGQTIESGISLKEQKKQAVASQKTAATLEAQKAQTEAIEKEHAETALQEERYRVGESTESQKKQVFNDYMKGQDQFVNEQLSKQEGKKGYSRPYQERRFKTEYYHMAMNELDKFEKTPSVQIARAFEKGEYKDQFEFRKAHIEALRKEQAERPSYLMTDKELSDIYKKEQKERKKGK